MTDKGTVSCTTLNLIIYETIKYIKSKNTIFLNENSLNKFMELGRLKKNLKN